MKFINQLTKISVVFGLVLFSLPALAGVQIETWQTSNGAKVLFVESKQLPMLDVEIAFDAGSARDGDRWGLASMTSGLIGTATSQLNEDQISQGFNEIGAQTGSSVNRDSASVSLRTLTRQPIMDKALALFAATLSDAEFDRSVYEREMKRAKIALQQRSVKPQVIANDKLWETLYQGHPYGHPVSGTIESIKMFKLDDLKAFYERYYVAANATIAMVGNISREKAEKIAEQLVQGLDKGQKPDALPQPKTVESQDIQIKFDSTQTYYSLTQLGVERGNSDYIPLFVGNHILGGSGFGSLLMEEVREKRGLVYSVYSYFAPKRVAGPFLIGLSTKNASAYEADQVVKETLDAFMDGFSQEKLDAIKENLIGGFPLRIDSNGKILGYLSMIGFYGLPLDYLDWFPKEVEKVSKQDVLKAWQKHIQPDNMVKIMVGNPVTN